MRNRNIASILSIMFSAMVLAGCGATAPAVITQTVRSNIPARFTESGYNQYLGLMIGDNTEYIDSVTEEDGGSAPESFEAMSEDIVLNHEPVTNGVFFHLANNGNDDISVRLTVNGKTLKVPCLLSGESRSVFADVPNDLFSRGYVVNPGKTYKGDLPVVILEKGKASGTILSDVSVEADFGDMTESEQATASSLKEKGFYIFEVPEDMESFNIRYYAGGNLCAGGNMETSEAYRFGEDSCYYAVKVSSDIQADAAEMDVYY